MAVDLGRFDAGAVGGVDPADPGHAGDRIQAEVDELPMRVDLFLRHVQFLREQVPEGNGEIRLGGGIRRHRLGRDGPGRHGRRRRRYCSRR